VPRYDPHAQEKESVTKDGALRTLLAGAIDYAGLFPPAKLSMEEAVTNYDAYLRSPDAWALGRFVVPVARLTEFAEVSSHRWPRGETGVPWRVSALLSGEELEAEIEQVAAFNTKHGRSGGIIEDGERGGAWIDTVELRCDRPDRVTRAEIVIPHFLETYIEVPITGDPEALVRAIADSGLKAKIRTGGVTADAFPSAAQIARFLSCCLACRVAFKATAGLHHPLRSEYPLTYDAGAPSGTMFGYLNVFLAAALLRAGESEAIAVQVLEERDVRAMRVTPAGIEWRARALSSDALRAVHSDFARAFGSCSFTEPIEEARAMGLL
jgi:hypothetical protein